MRQIRWTISMLGAERAFAPAVRRVLKPHHKSAMTEGLADRDSRATDRHEGSTRRGLRVVPCCSLGISRSTGQYLEGPQRELTGLKTGQRRRLRAYAAAATQGGNQC